MKRLHFQPCLEEWAEEVEVRLRLKGNTEVGYGLVCAEREFGK
jgi:hypothetical protein